jgi:hypothetical protein
VHYPWFLYNRAEDGFVMVRGKTFSSENMEIHIQAYDLFPKKRPRFVPPGC